MAKRKKPRGAEFKAKVALEAMRERKTVSQLGVQFDAHPTQIHQWKKELLQRAAELFQPKRGSKQAAAQQADEAELYEQIGRLKMELEWLKKKLDAVD